MSTCSQTNIPTLNVVEESCNGYYPPTRCIIHEPAIPLLGILAGETLQNIIATITTNLYNQSTRIASLETQIEILESQIENCCG
jgi:hypothetical protein